MKKTLTLFGIILIPSIAIISVILYLQSPQRLLQKAEATDLSTITEGTDTRLVLLYIGGLPGDNEDGFIEGSHTVMSTDGSNNIQITSGTYEALDSDNVFVWGQQVDATTPSAFFIRTDSIQEIETNGDTPQHLSLSPSKEYILYTTGPKEYCIASLSENEIGDCTSLTDILVEESEQFESQISEIEWNSDEESNTVTIRIRDRENHTEVESPIEGNPPLRVQNELERFEYTVDTGELVSIDLSSPLSLKEMRKPQRTEGKIDNLQIKYANWENAIYLYTKCRKAKLFDAPFLGEMPGFDLYVF